jgi:hypothetical protein
MNVEIGAEAAQFPEKEYINGIAFAVCTVYAPGVLCGAMPNKEKRDEKLNLIRKIESSSLIVTAHLEQRPVAGQLREKDRWGRPLVHVVHLKIGMAW